MFIQFLRDFITRHFLRIFHKLSDTFEYDGKIIKNLIDKFYKLLYYK